MALRHGRKEEKMNDDKNKIILEMNFKIQMKDYRHRFVTKKAWIISLILIVCKILWSFKGDLSP
tara:strand:- start:7 stop:198 length:192 start_codon:yes stop_codon:yes gene_type:complete